MTNGRKRLLTVIAPLVMVTGLATAALAQSYSFVGQSENGKTQRQFKGTCSIDPGSSAFICPNLHTPTNNCKMTVATAGGIDLADWPYSLPLSVVGNPLGSTCPIPAGAIGILYPEWLYPNGSFNAVWIGIDDMTLMDGMVLTIQ